MLLLFFPWVYLLAATPVGLILTTLYGGAQDIRAVGSGNIGATNVARTYGWGLAAPVLILDMSKGLLPVLIARVLWGDSLWILTLTALTAFLGHCFSLYLEFRGGKGVATAAGAVLGITPLSGLSAVAAWVIVLALTGRSSMAALCGAVVLLGVVGTYQSILLVPVGLLTLGIVYTHIANIRRLVRGEEPQIVRPVSWNNRGEKKKETAELLLHGPAGTQDAPGEWRSSSDESQG